MDYIFNLNLDNKKRMEIITGREWTASDDKRVQKEGGIEHFGIDRTTLNELIENNFVNLDDAQNDAPTIKAFTTFCDKYPDEEFEFIGYAVNPSRNDYRISIEGLCCETYNRDLVVDFITTFKRADELRYDEEELYCWFD